MSKDDFLSSLNEIQRQAVVHTNGPLLIAAGAGSGKTRTLTCRLMQLLKSGIAPGKIIAITFTNKAAREMQNRISNSQLLISNYKLPFVGTFHSLGAHILKKQSENVNRTKYFTIFDEEDSLSLIKQILKDLNLAKDKFNPLMIAKQISKIKGQFIELDDLSLNNQYKKILQNVFEKYEATLAKNNAFDFDDLIEKVVRVFEDNPNVLKKYQQQWNYILVDEFQDVNTSQYILIKLLAKEHKNLFVIGDDSQSIYGFRGSDFTNFLNFEEDWPNAKTVKLEENYRSTQNIIKAASNLIKFNKLQKPKELWTKNPEGNLIQISAFEDGENEAHNIAENILKLIRKKELPSEIAVLYRTNAQSRAIEQALIYNNIPYEIFGGIKFYSRKEIKDIIAGLRYALNPKDQISKERLIKNFAKSKYQILNQELPRLSNELSLTELIKFILENTNYETYLEKNFKNPGERMENIRELINFASTFSAKGGSGLYEFLEQISLMSSLDSRPKLNEKTVRLTTIHLAKGLEFNNIFIVGCNDGLLPHERSMTNNDDLEEERRLMYVAMTRAKKNLHISFYSLPSRFLGELPAELIEFTKNKAFDRQLSDWDEDEIYLE